jgi:hypothetical protein
VKFVPAGMLNTKQAGAPTSKLPFWNGAAAADAVKANSKLAKDSLATRPIAFPFVTKPDATASVGARPPRVNACFKPAIRIRPV